MGQRTQIIVVHDVCYGKDYSLNSDIRMVTAHHCQWGYGRPVCMDILNLAMKAHTGNLSPYTFGFDKKSIKGVPKTLYQYRQMCTHISPLTECDDVNKMTHFIKDDDRKMHAIAFCNLFDCFDNNNGGAVFWAVDYHAKNHHVFKLKYGCVLGSEETDEPFQCFLDGSAYMLKTNDANYVKPFHEIFNNAMKSFEVSLLRERDTLDSIIEELKCEK